MDHFFDLVGAYYRILGQGYHFSKKGQYLKTKNAILKVDFKVWCKNDHFMKHACFGAALNIESSKIIT